MHIHPEGHRRFWGHNWIYGPLKVLNAGLQNCLGTQSTSQDPPFNYGESTLPYGPGPSSFGPGRMGQKGLERPYGPCGTPEPLVTGGTIWLWGIPVAPMDHKAPKLP
ncbi:hypothetical protein O181_096933 [Austropuccinia psidii MF-1]|uniref:Uncharacterized protein n=1 Tax=Austropuccinia psidii MF-1 TaxID=1389203 RepID=A0A9Q3J7Y1_9BASI|nr:hypothetical protein [Austropuccinia psidii MF-1]